MKQWRQHGSKGWADRSTPPLSRLPFSSRLVGFPHLQRRPLPPPVFPSLLWWRWIERQRGKAVAAITGVKLRGAEGSEQPRHDHGRGRLSRAQRVHAAAAKLIPHTAVAAARRPFPRLSQSSDGHCRSARRTPHSIGRPLRSPPAACRKGEGREE
ncbi:hypothetical protein [Oryza sativa Japonica Group]|uniref:Uncharacterized protein P0710A02.29 n=1 Tax=Oryza sativa subsp. japonica TaxID=39947 RepID=Q5ZD37_ORYSJ|nr:hypothetical protein [Oryza sativa Japonica Group]